MCIVCAGDLKNEVYMEIRIQKTRGRNKAIPTK